MTPRTYASPEAFKRGGCHALSDLLAHVVVNGREVQQQLGFGC